MNLYPPTFREFFLNLIRASRFWAKLYSNLIVIYCKAIVLKRNSYDALTLLCDAQRRIPDMDIIEKCTDLIEQILQENYCVDGKMLPIEKNKLLGSFYRSKRFCDASQIFATESEIDRLRLRHAREKSSYQRQGNVIILKKPVTGTGEKGVLLLKYTPTFEQFLSIFDISSLSKEYRVVFEPSWYRNIEASLFLYSGLGIIHIFQAAHEDDRALLNKLTSSINSIDLGSGDWIDATIFTPTEERKLYDIVMVASWAKFKRHEILFKSLRKLKLKGRNLRVALIGYPMDLTIVDIINKARKYEVESLCDFYEQLPALEVARMVASSRLALHLSKYEGTNKASYEAWLCNVPLIVYKNNVGFRKNYVNDKTGILADDNELVEAIERILNCPDTFSPRKWILEHSGYLNATNKLNETLREVAIKNGEPWTVDIVLKKNCPNFLYAKEKDRIEMEPAYYQLKKHLLR